ncbi:MAG: gliding motility-associated C-terminal domain-containing protein, partial [Bacteroidia bacterium]|nr:gliding motility-associated C-terminal domain-containing protein [Bacteroidia bacterium]
LSSTLFSVTATVNNCPSASATRFVQVDSAAKPIADAGISRYGCIGDTVILSGTGGAKYAWKPANLLSLPNTQHPSYFVFTTQQFTLTVTNIKCSSTDTITILADKCLDDISFIPQIITVNNDGVNDLFYIPDIDYFTNNTVTIYNRWGDEVFQAHPYLNTFDGTGKGGKNLPEGAYYYVIDLANGKAKIHKGIFMIER